MHEVNIDTKNICRFLRDLKTNTPLVSKQTKEIPLQQIIQVCDTPSFCNYEILKQSYIPNETEQKFLISHRIKYKNIVDIKVIEIIDGLEFQNSSINIKGIEYHSVDCCGFEEILGLFHFYKSIIKSEKLSKNGYIILLLENIKKLLKRRENILKITTIHKNHNEILDKIAYRVLSNVIEIEEIVFENIALGLSQALKNATAKIEYNYHPTRSILKSTLEQNWTKIDENSYSREKIFRVVV